MKKIVLFLVATITTISSFAQRNSDLTVSTTGTSNLRIQLNGRKVALKDRSITFENMQPGTYALAIYQWQKKQNRGNEYVEVFNNTLKLTAGKHIEVTVLRFGKVVWDEGFATYDDWNDGNDSSPIGGGGNSGYDGNHGQNAVNDIRFKEVKTAISGSFNDESKLATANTVMKNNWFTVGQIKELAGLFSFDPNKLQFLKNAYSFCTEKGSYFTLSEILTFSSNKQDFMKWVGER
jgi:hypothetical protein